MHVASQVCRILGSERVNVIGPWVLQAVIAVVCCAVLGVGAEAQEGGRVGLPEDWSHQHVVFSGGGPVSPDVARAVVSDPRFWHQQFRRAARAQAGSKGQRGRPRRIDWSVNLGGAGSRLAAGTYPAKYTFNINASPSCANDFAVFALNIAGSGTQATIVAYNNLYAGSVPATGICGSGGPTVKWAYNTGQAINTSPVLSLDGRKVAWVANANPPVLHVLTIGTSGGNGTAVNSPVTPGVGNNAVDTQVTFGSIGDTRSSLFVDYHNDVAYVASDDGNIHKFSTLFSGTPTEVTGGGWPIHGQDAGNHVLTGVIFDSVSGNLFYGSDAGTLGYIREVGSTRGVCASGTPPCLGLNFYSLTGAIIDAPVIDQVAQNVFVFLGNNGASHAAIQQADTQLSSNGPKVNIGQNGPALLAGTFDNNYYTNPASGFLYVCGYATAGTARPTLYRVGFDSNKNLKSVPDASLTLTSVATTCSPMTEIFNPPTLKDWMFVSVADGCAITGGGTAGCVMSFDVTSGFPSNPSTQQGRPATSGTSGIIVDNVSTSAQASSIYFSTQGDGTCGDGSGTGCAVKMTQSGLQ